MKSSIWLQNWNIALRTWTGNEWVGKKIYKGTSQVDYKESLGR